MRSYMHSAVIRSARFPAMLDDMRRQGTLHTPQSMLVLIELEVEYFRSRMTELRDAVPDVSESILNALRGESLTYIKHVAQECYGTTDGPGATVMLRTLEQRLEIAAQEVHLEIRRGTSMESKPGNTYNFHGGAVNLNTGTIFGNVTQMIGEVKNEALANTLRDIQTFIVESKQSDQWKQEMLEHLEFLVAETKKPPQGRSKPAILSAIGKQLTSGLSLAADFITVGSKLGSVLDFLGLS